MDNVAALIVALVAVGACAAAWAVIYAILSAAT